MDNSGYHVVLVDDDKELLDVISLDLQDQKFTVRAFSDPHAALSYVETNPIDAVVLDYHMQGYDPLETYKSFRLKKSERPILFLTGDIHPDVRMGCLEVGADDFLHKPISIPELSAHLRNRIRAYRKSTPSIIRIKNLEVNLNEPLVLLNGKEIALTPKEFQMLCLLVTHPNTIVKKATIVGKLWPEVKVEDNNVDTHISNLRKKMAGLECEIKTVKCFGYILKV
jgi:DNA-binding response OmpR family regulator